MKHSVQLGLLVGAAFLGGCGGTTPPAQPAHAAPAPAAIQGSQPALETNPDGAPLGPAPTESESVNGRPTDETTPEKRCSVWSGGPTGDAPPPKGHDPNPCGPDARCECMAQAGYSCSGACKPK